METLKDYRINHAQEEILATYGDVVDVDYKNKGLLKFGRSNIDSNDHTVMTLPGTEHRETYVSDNLITHFASGSTDDTTQSIVVEGHRIVDNQFIFSIQTVTLGGNTKKALTTPLARATRAYNIGSTDLTGPVYFSQDVTYSLGVPQTDSAIHLIIPAGKNQTEKCATALSYQDYWIITNAYCDVLEKASAFIIAELEFRPFGQVFRHICTWSASNSSRGVINFDPYLIIPKNSDVRVQASASTTNVDCSAGIQGYLAIVR